VAVTITAIHKWRLAKQVVDAIADLQIAIVNNSNDLLAKATAQSVPAGTLSNQMALYAAGYTAMINKFIALRNDSVKKQLVLDVLTFMGWSDTDLVAAIQDIRPAVIAYSAAARVTYGDIIAAQNALLAAVDVPPSL
jgi:hypothetical protein